MLYTSKYDSPLGSILLAADEQGLTGLWLENNRFFPNKLESQPGETEDIRDAKRWLNIYFSGREPDFTPRLHQKGSDFHRAVGEIMLKIPYGKTTTYGAIAKELAEQRGIARMSAQAVGGAVGRNEISIIIPCHRVVGSNGSLTGYGGGLDNKIKLLELEGADMSRLYRPKKGTAL